ncbi:MAG: hypothetical protein NC418_09375 [Muribaculaceae bacterium]|nr:hypothetical protein [Muribaculaceae bacterium]
MQLFKQSLITATLILLSALLSHAEQFNSDMVSCIRHYQYANIGTDADIPHTSIPAKNMRHSSEGGTFVFMFQDVPDSMQTVIRAAADVWASKIHSTHPIYIEVSYFSLADYGDNPASITSTFYFKNGANALPSALYSYINEANVGRPDSPDALIWFNSDFKWDCACSAESLSNQSLNTYSYTLRAMALSLGFGSSVSLFGDDLCFQEVDTPSVFDEIIFSESAKLTDYIDDSDGLHSFVVSEPIYAANKENDNKMYSPQVYDMGKTLVYLDNPNSLMHHDLGYGDGFFEIDGVTLDLLNKIGWDFSIPQPVSIQCSDIGPDGIGSAYTSHLFSLSENEAIIKYWEFKVMDSSYSETTICTSNEAIFEIPAIGDDNQYLRNSNGDIVGIVECEFEYNGKIENKLFKLSLELKPKINYISDIEKHWKSGTNNFGLTFSVNYSGADDLTLYIEQEYSSGITMQRISEPFIAHACIRNLSSVVYTWVDVTVSNKYGSVTETIELEPESSSGASDLLASNFDAFGHEEYFVYNSQGISMGVYTGSKINKDYLPTGLYFVRGTSPNSLNSFKIYVR